jgi:hypothetical protein
LASKLSDFGMGLFGDRARQRAPATGMDQGFHVEHRLYQTR